MRIQFARGIWRGKEKEKQKDCQGLFIKIIELNNKLSKYLQKNKI
jgi:hypothetical protein